MVISDVMSFVDLGCSAGKVNCAKADRKLSCAMTATAHKNSFSDKERADLLAIKGVGPTVVTRLEDLGIASFSDLADRSAAEICEAVAAMLGASCWKNSPQSQRAIEAAIACAKSRRNDEN